MLASNAISRRRTRISVPQCRIPARAPAGCSPSVAEPAADRTRDSRIRREHESPPTSAARSAAPPAPPGTPRPRPCRQAKHRERPANRPSTENRGQAAHHRRVFTIRCDPQHNPRAPEVLTGHPPRSGTWPAPAPAWLSPWSAGRSARPAGQPPGGPGAASARPAPGVPGAPPLGDQAGVQALTAQDRAFLPVRRRLVGREDLLLVRRGERPPPRPLGHLGIRAPPAVISHRTSIGAEPWSLSSQGISVPALEPLINKGRVSHLRLADRAGSCEIAASSVVGVR